MNNIFPYNLAMSQINKFGLSNMTNMNNFNGMNNVNKFNNNGLQRNNVYEENENTYVDYLKKYKNDTYKNYLNKSQANGNNRISKITSNRSMNNRNSNYQIVFDEERESRGTGTVSIYY
jgi:hypothetical protein